MSIPLYVFLGLYLVGLAIYLLLSFFNVYHAFRFGIKDTMTGFVVTTYLVVTVLILVATSAFILTIDWSQTWQPFELPEINISL
ncbi:MAG: hypothetical protein HYV34_00455 [Candidatus Kerfeldbacteria bacterium]|nr:hypothetical protein [Candidatus Kerfeldbacteria bacterium]